MALAVLAGCAQDAKPRHDPDLAADALAPEVPDAAPSDASLVDAAGDAAPSGPPDAEAPPACCPGDAPCAPPGVPCAADCETLARFSYGAWAEPPPSGTEVERIAGRVSVADGRFVVEAEGGRRAFGFEMPPGEALPLVDGDEVEVATTPDRVGGWRVEVSAADGPRLAFLRERAVEPRRVFGLTIGVEDVDCGPSVVGDCILLRNAVAILRGDAPRPLPVGQVAPVTAPDGARYRVFVTAAVIDEDACRPPAETGPFLGALVLRDR
jgi:hypothetical protein